MPIHFKVWAEVDARLTTSGVDLDGNGKEIDVDYEIVKGAIELDKRFDSYLDTLLWLKEQGFVVDDKTVKNAPGTEEMVRDYLDGAG